MKKNNTLKKIAAAGTLAVVLSAGAVSPAFAYTQPEINNVDFEAVDNIITEQDWETLSDAQIDAKLKKAGLETIGDTQSPFYNMTMAQIDGLSDEEFDKLAGDYFGDEKDFEYDEAAEAELNNYFKTVDNIITEQDWETLSDAQIDAKLKKAGLETIGDTQSPFYNMTMAQIDGLSDEEFDKLAGSQNFKK